ncbi:cytochrome P450 [Actinocorallia longicatena]|uniref:Cytochrome P450 n=1 Tax=Actinocorallia longicatena TaxID=111803 RepID=A0ABP6Q3H0_9ACTN
MRPPGTRVPSIVQTVRFLRDPGRLLEGMHRRHGPVFALRFLGFPPEVFVTTIELAEKVYGLDASGGRAGELRRRFLEPVVGKNSLLCLDHDPWQRHRKVLTPPLRARAIASYADEIAEIAIAEVDRIPLGRPVALRDHMQAVTLEVMLRLVFGIRDGAHLERLRVLLPALMEVGGSNVLMMTPEGIRRRLETSRIARSLRFLPSTRFANVRDEVDALLFAEIERRRSEPAGEATDVLARLLDARDEAGEPLSDQELRDELITMLEAGHETTATGLAWTFERLLRNPGVLARLREEIETGESQEYLEATVKEALRSRPVIWDAPRLVDEPLDLGGHRVEPGWFAAPLIALIHRDPAHYPDPDAFRPERFLGEEAARSAKAWMPFGGGRRYCVGAQLALLEMRVILRETLLRLDLEAVEQAPERARMKHVTLVPARNATAVATLRKRVTVPPA